MISQTMMSRHQKTREKLISLLQTCGSIKELERIHAKLIKNAIYKPNFVLSKSIELRDLTYSFSIFNNDPKPDNYAFNVMIRGLTTTWKIFNLSLSLYYRMKNIGLKPDNFTFPFVFIACSSNRSEFFSHALGAHSTVFKLGLDADRHVSNSLVTMYSKFGELGFARKVFGEIPHRDLVSWNAMISGYSKMGFSREALGLFGEMRKSGFEPDETSFVSALGAIGDLGDLEFGRFVEKLVLGAKMEIGSFLGSSLIGMYGKCGDLCSAKRVFDSIAKKERVTWNAMISGYAQNGFSDEAIMLFKEMKVAGIDPDNITLVVILSACASVGALDMGKRIDKYASEHGLQKDVYVATALLDMYAKCGSIDDAMRIFEEMPQKNEVSWNAMISALAFNGRANEALSLFRRMVEKSRPDKVTFVGVLSACVHAGLVDEGRKLFYSMSSSFGVKPEIEHYSCVVDLLARSGRVQEAWSLVEEMKTSAKLKPDAVLLGAWLAACQKCKNDIIAEKVMKLLLDLEPSNAGNYIISSKVYANLNKWDESARMRVLMRDRGVNKTPGCSWIEFENQLYEFHAGDLFSNGSTEIGRVFGSLNDELIREGYVPNLGIV